VKELSNNTIEPVDTKWPGYGDAGGLKRSNSENREHELSKSRTRKGEPARYKRIDKRGGSQKVRKIMPLKIEKNSSRGNRTEFGDGRSFIVRRGTSPLIWFDLKK
jgi:hypothetical protein